MAVMKKQKTSASRRAACKRHAHGSSTRILAAVDGGGAPSYSARALSYRALSAPSKARAALRHRGISYCNRASARAALATSFLYLSRFARMKNKHERTSISRATTGFKNCAALDGLARGGGRLFKPSCLSSF